MHPLIPHARSDVCHTRRGSRDKRLRAACIPTRSPPISRFRRWTSAASPVAPRLLPTAGAGGAALTLWALRRTGIGARAAARTLLTFLVLLYAVFLAAIAASGAVIALGGHGPLTLSAVPALGATAGIAVALALGLRRRPTPGSGGRIRRAAALLGDATADAIALLRTADARLIGAIAWWL